METVAFAGITKRGTSMFGQFRLIFEFGYGFASDPAD